MDSTAISVGIAIQSGTLLQKCGNYWCRINTSQVVNSSLVNSINSSIVSLVENYQYNNCNTWIIQVKGTNKNSNSCAVSGNGLMYDNCESGFAIAFSYADSYCSNKGMRLPSLTETTASSIDGVPSCSDWTWTNTKFGTSTYFAWFGNAQKSFLTTNNRFIRCVK